MSEAPTNRDEDATPDTRTAQLVAIWTRLVADLKNLQRPRDEH